MKRKFKQCWSTITPISTKWRMTFHLKSLIQKTTTCDVGNPCPDLGQLNCITIVIWLYTLCYVCVWPECLTIHFVFINSPPPKKTQTKKRMTWIIRLDIYMYKMYIDVVQIKSELGLVELCQRIFWWALYWSSFGHCFIQIIYHCF